MPTYQYVCRACDEPLEAVQAFSDPALTECPACGGRLRKVFSSVGIVFKGSGFYRNDSREAVKAGADRAGGDGKTSETSETPSSDGKSGGSKAGDKAISKPSGDTTKTPATASAGG